MKSLLSYPILSHGLRLFKWAAVRLRDLFFGPGNVYLDLGRILATITALALICAQAWNIYLGKEIDLGPSGLGGGLAAVLTAAAALIAAKDIASFKSRNGNNNE